MELVRPTATQATPVDVQRIHAMAEAVGDDIANLQALCRIIGTWGEMKGELPPIAIEDVGRLLCLVGSRLEAIGDGVDDIAGHAECGLPAVSAIDPHA